MKALKIIVFTTALLLTFFSEAEAQAPPSYYKGVVINVEKEETKKQFNNEVFSQILKVKLLEGPNKNKEIRFENTGNAKIANQKKVAKDEIIIVLSSTDKGRTIYSVWDKYRLTPLIYILIGFFILVIIFAGIKGIGSIIGMGVSLATLLLFVVPQILKGRDPLMISILGSVFIMIVSIYLAHGLSKKTSIAVFSTFTSLVLTGILSFVFVSLAKLSGLGDESAYTLKIGQSNINVEGLLLGGIIIGTLGVLDDVTTSQSTAIEELSKADSKLSFTDLIYRGYKIGREHIVSLVNTLVLAYAGASLSLFIIFVINPLNVPYWVILNSESVSEEIIRTLAGSIGLILAVPITTVTSAWFFSKRK